MTNDTEKAPIEPLPGASGYTYSDPKRYCENAFARELWRLVPRRYRKYEWTLKRQSHQAANDSKYPAFNIWVRGDEWTEATFLLGDLCSTWNFKRDGGRLMVWSPNV